jgi:hypothetical protein
VINEKDEYGNNDNISVKEYFIDKTKTEQFITKNYRFINYFFLFDIISLTIFEIIDLISSLNAQEVKGLSILFIALKVKIFRLNFSLGFNYYNTNFPLLLFFKEKNI